MKDFSKRIAELSPGRLVLLATELHSRLEQIKRRKHEPIAVIGTGCRFPRGIKDPEEYWRALNNGVDAVQEIFPSRWDIKRYYDPDLEAPGKTTTKWAGLIDDVELFDARFFGIGAREALSMDPQQRLLLEVCWEALERADQAPDTLLGTRTGVFVGISGNDYSTLQRSRGEAEIDAYFASGNAHSVASGRISYFLGTKGPSLSVDTACSSSLVAVHLAIQSLRSDECTMAITGGVNLILTPDVTIALSKADMMASDGRCKTFDDRADGFVRGEGCGILVLKRLSDALKDGDNILATIIGSAVNQDGRSNGLTAPNGPSQEDVIQQALINAEISPADMDYIEAHGTGTSLGDPIELRALGAVFCQNRSAEDPLIVGAVKTNLGHLESAAGIAGLIKLIQCVQYGKIPPNLHFKTPNPHIDWKRLPVSIPIEPILWPSRNARRIGGVSSFGFSGTNAHVVVAEPPPQKSRLDCPERPCHILTLSAKSEQALVEMAGNYADALEESPQQSIGDVCFSANIGRARMPYRIAIVNDALPRMAAALKKFSRGVESRDLVKGKCETLDAPEVAFIFTGQGSQYVGMGRELFDTHSGFRHTLEECDSILRPHLPMPLLSVLYPGPGKEEEARSCLNQTAYTQPALFALEYALAQLWQTWGVKPSAVMGHSVGEYVAACVAGVFSLEDGLRLIAERARLMQALPAGGTMAAVFADQGRVSAMIEAYGDRIVIAAMNGPENTVISGVKEDIQSVLKRCEAEGIEFRPLNVSHAFHSPLMDPMLDTFSAFAQSINYETAHIDLISNITGKKVGETDLLNGSYWRSHIRRPVRFEESVKSLSREGYRIFLEIGPRPTLIGMGMQFITDSGVTWLPSLHDQQGDWQRMLTSVAAIHVQGAQINWRNLDSDWPRQKIILPTYPFQRKRFWQGGIAAPPPQAQEVTSEKWREWLYEFDWESKAQDGLVSRNFLPEPHEIAETVIPQLQPLISQHGIEVYDYKFRPQLDTLCSAYILQALKRLGWDFSREKRIKDSQLKSTFEILDVHQRLLHRMFAILEEDGILVRDGSEWVYSKTDASIEPELLRKELVADFPECIGELEMIGNCAGNIAEVMQGKCDPIQLLFPKGSLDYAEQMYQNSPVLRVFNSLIQKSFAAIVNNMPDNGKIRILEIGAGTGSATSFVLPVLPQSQTEYVYTDLSEAFLTHAKKKFKDYAFVDYQALDVDKDPQAQGYRLHSFDVVLAANVLHATPNLNRTLSNIKKLLAPTGTLLLLEGVSFQRFSDLTVGLTKGWWHFSDDDLRPSYALLSKRQWDSLLQGAGFTELVTIPGNQVDDTSTLAQQAVLITRNNEIVPKQISSGAGVVVAPWLILADTEGYGRKLADELENRGKNCIFAVPGDDFQTIDTNTISFDSLNPDHHKLLLKTAKESGHHGYEGVVYFSGIEEQIAPGMQAVGLEKSQEKMCAGLVNLIQAIAGVKSELVPSLVLVTRNAHSVIGKEEACGFPQASLWGLGRVISMEHPELNCLRIDIDPKKDDFDIATFTDEILSPGSNEMQVAFRKGERFVLRLQRCPLSSQPANTSAGLFQSANAAYLITGGLAGLGFEIAHWMVQKGAKNLFLLGRSGPSPEALKKIEQMSKMGAEITIVQADVGENEELKGVFDKIRSEKKELRGILHCAGTLDDGVLLQQNWERFRTVMKAKVLGSWNLHCLTEKLNLDFFTLFSSGAAFLGSSSQGNHAAANAFMDALAYYRKSKNLPAMSINWGAWSEVGAATKNNVTRRIQMKGLDLITPEEGLTVLGHLLETSVTQVAVLPIRWQTIFKSIDKSNESTFFERFAQFSEKETLAQKADSTPEFLEELKKSSPGRRHELLLKKIETEVVKILGLEEDQPADHYQPLIDMGLDSLLAVELRNSINVQVKKSLPATLIYDFPTINELITHIEEILWGSSPDSISPGEENTSEMITDSQGFDIEDYSEEEMAHLLAEKLKSL